MSQDSGQGQAPPTPGSPLVAARATRLYMLRRRHELLGHIGAINELIDALSAEEAIRSSRRILGDLEIIRSNATRMDALLRIALGADESGTEAAARALNHDLRSVLTPIVNYGDEVRRSVLKLALHEFAADADALRAIGRRLLALVDSTVVDLRSTDGGAPVDQVEEYLQRFRDQGEDDGGPVEPTSDPGRILVAEDHDHIRGLLRDYLAELGHDVITARDGMEAIMLLGNSPVDLVLTDVEMPRADGIAVLQHIKSHPALHDVPVIIISGHGELDSVARCIKIGAEDYLPKPFNRIILRARVDASLEKKRLRDRNEEQRRRYQDLLNAILPGPVVEELSRTKTVRTRRHESVAVLFADIVGFTPYCDRNRDHPEKVVEYLREMFEAWEEMASGLSVQKIKTIGDAFMAASALLESTDNPVANCVELGLRMIRFTQQMCDGTQTPLGFNLRVGVHYGPVIGGVLGRRQALYDLWGDTVNIASRLESHGLPGCVNLSAVAWDRVDQFYTGETRSKRQLKGKADPIDVVHLDAGVVGRRDRVTA